jgi:hypothetical protein
MQNLVFQVKLERKMSPVDHRKNTKSAAIQVPEYLQFKICKQYKGEGDSNTPLILDTQHQGSRWLYEAYCPRVNNMQRSPVQADLVIILSTTTKTSNRITQIPHFAISFEEIQLADSYQIPF